MRLQNVVFACRDYEAMVQFYGHVLQLEVFFENDNCTFFKAGSAHVAVHRPASDSQAFDGGACLDFAVADLEEEISRIESAGIVVRRDGADLACFEDPNGNLVELIPL